jgi:hypothetical protein
LNNCWENSRSICVFKKNNKKVSNGLSFAIGAR